ncbi:PREDICTED: pentatricopeptide repeat-containing protein At3g51320 [Populus euphratica]|uniref:Pentatricopeptide repeat-containing protein At3g51320 n=1 Tax=Populus euphratica TaxID=75702 RepID=A0AAJ6V8U3_POPEU|nr:PREDICTED: pentatricopeptide repeat-containing protein At3g51320 [Populus euphratica]XP_011043146.1 PREDICTED: pentatricopeptide repeat-containing protein At3g51320 [Populus euphratica]
MARISTRDIFKFRHAMLTHYPYLPTPKQITLLSPSSSYSVSIKDMPITSYNNPRFELLYSTLNPFHLYQIQAQLITCGLFSLWSPRLLKHFADFGDIEYTIFIFKFIASPGTFVVNNVVKAYSLSSEPNKALAFYFEMLKSGFCPNSYTFVSLFGCCAKVGCAKLGRKCHGQAVKNGVDRILPVENSLIHCYGCCGDMGLAKKVFDEMSHRDLVSWNSIMDGYATLGELGIAHGLFEVMPERNVVSWNILISGYLKGNNPGCVLMLFRKMMNDGMRGNDSTIVSVLSACGRSARLREGRSVHGFIVKKFSSMNVIHETTLIDMYNRCHKVEMARRIFDKVARRNLGCWNAMILGHCLHGNPDDGLELFKDMVDRAGLGKRDSVHPDEVTFIGVLCACARAGLLTEGKNFFSQMIYNHGLKPNFAHFWCMANLYARAGLIQEAEDILRTTPEEEEDMPLESLAWANLLNSCRFQGNVALGERIANSLIDMEPWNFLHYRLLLNVYAVGGRWDDVAMVKDLVKTKMKGRTPGCNLVDLKKIVHNYEVGRLLPERIGELNTQLMKWP